MRKENRELRKLIENIQVEQGNNSRLRSITPNSIKNHESARVGNF